MVNVPRFYRVQTFDHVLFGYVQGLRRALPSMSVSEAVRTFLDAFQIPEDEYCFDAAKATYYRLINAMVEMGDKSKVDNNLII